MPSTAWCRLNIRGRYPGTPLAVATAGTATASIATAGIATAVIATATAAVGDIASALARNQLDEEVRGSKGGTPS